MAKANRRQPPPEHRAKDAAFSQDLSQTDFEIEFYGSVLRRHPDYLDVLRRQAELLARAGRFAESLPLEERLAALTPDNCLVRYNLACSLARLGQCESALQALQLAVTLGYDDFGHMESDPDLVSLHALPGYQKILRRGKATSK